MHERDIPGLSTEGRLTGDEFRSASFEAVSMIGDMLRSTYGPCGQDKLMINSNGTGYVSNQGSEILDRIEVRNPVTRLLVNAWEFTDRYADGSTFATLFAAALVDEAETLIEEGVSPVSIAQGYKRAADVAANSLTDVAVSLNLTDQEQYALVATATTGRLPKSQIDHLRQVILDTGMILAPEVSLDRVQFEQNIRLGIDSTRVVRGTVLRSDPLHEGMPYEIDSANVLLLSDSISRPDPENIRQIENVTLSGPDGVAGALESRNKRFESQLEVLQSSGADVVVCLGHLDNRVMNELADSGILAFDGLLQEKFERVHNAVGGQSTPSADLENAELGYAERVVVSNVGSGSIKGVLFVDCPDTDIASIIVNAGTAAGGSLTKRILRQGIGTLAAAYEEPKAIPGGGASELVASRAVRDAVTGVSGSEQLAVEAYTDALEAPVAQLIQNAGYPPLDVLPKLTSAHSDGEQDAALDITAGGIKSAYETGIIEPLLTKHLAIQGATEFVASLLRIDAALPSINDESKETDLSSVPSSGGERGGMPR